MSLPELQYRFINAIFDRDQRDAAAALVKAHGALDAVQRVGIYRNSVHGILLQYLRSLYPVCQQLLGDDFFEAASDRYIDQSPPTRPFLAEYADEFADFLHHYPALSTMPWIAEIARLEWARHQAWNAVNQPASDFAQLALLDAGQQEHLTLHTPNSAHLLQSPYAIHPIWLAHQPEDHPDKLPLERLQIQQASTVLIWRTGRRLQQVVLDKQAWDFLAAVQQRATLPELAERFQEQLAALLMNAVQRGWILSFSTDLVHSESVSCESCI
ncbi:putative DNA-binding domain-containing protein [Thiothrix lacustris]|uniref:HvfC/BufC family peptide modification chaperone n=1 Tax=Thiothrix lacustris TaxID=525917 RepID=UPI000685BFF8|nr:putative DNA-binding domain-containing protein [Thiothrix lacustris]